MIRCPLVLERLSLDQDTGEVLYRRRPSRATHPEGPVARGDGYEVIARVLDHLPKKLEARERGRCKALRAPLAMSARKPSATPQMPLSRASSSGGGGNRTRVRKPSPQNLYMLSPPL
jgi:hypothetical protein